MKLNLGDFKKLSSDKDKTVLQHKAGHQIHIAHSALSPKMREQLHALPMADGGPVPEASGKPDQGPSMGSKEDRAAVSKGVNDGGTSMSRGWSNLKSGLGFSNGGGVYGNAVPEDAGDEKIQVKDGGTKLPARNSGRRSGAPDWDGAHGSNGGSGGKGDLTTEMPGDDEQMKAKGGAVRKYANGGSTSESTQDSPEAIASDASSQAQQAPPQQAPVVINVGNGGAPQAGQAPAPQQQPNPSMANSLGQAISAPIRGALNWRNGVDQSATQGIRDFGAGLAGEPPEAPQTAQAPSPPAIGAPSQMPQVQQPGAMDQYAGAMTQGYNDQINGINNEAAATGSQGRQTAAIDNTYAAGQQQIMDDYTRHSQDLYSHMNDLEKAISDQKIDPERYIRNMGAGQKILTGLGILLGGSSNSAGGPNPALEYVNQNINRDIDAQKAELGKKENLLSKNLERSKDLRDATALTSLQLHGIATAQAQAIANKMVDPIAKAQALQGVGKLKQQMGIMINQYAIQKSLSGAGEGQDVDARAQQALNFYRATGNKDKAQDLESRYIPRVGVASIPLSEDARKQAVAMQDFHNQMSNLINWAQKHSGETKMTNPSDVNAGRAMAQAAQNSYRTAQAMGVYKASEAPLLEGEIPQNPTAFFNKFRVLPQYKAVMDNNARKMQTFGKAYGIDSFGKGAGSGQATGQTNYRPGSFIPIGK